MDNGRGDGAYKSAAAISRNRWTLLDACFVGLLGGVISRSPYRMRYAVKRRRGIILAGDGGALICWWNRWNERHRSVVSR